MGNSQRPPFSLSSIGAVSFFFSFPPALILYGINWKRLGKPEKAKVPIALGVIAGILLIILGVKGAELLKITPALNVAFIVLSYWMQKYPSYVDWKQLIVAIDERQQSSKK